MIDLPFNPDGLGDSILASYLRADPSRTPVLAMICGLLDDDGKVGGRARYYIVRSAFRRAVLRGILTAEGIKLPSWAYENSAAATANRHFVQGYRDQYNLHRQEQRKRAPDAFTAAAHLSAAIH